MGFRVSNAFNSMELTGRAATHVCESADVQCVLHAQAAEALIALRNDARQAAIEVKVVSAFRDFNRQLALWSAKFSGQRVLLDRSGQPLQDNLYENELIDAILIWSALPGASRHHWGTEVDLMDAGAVPAGYRPRLTPADYHPGGCFERLGGWLDSNMARYGFFRPYATDRGGVQPEPWHLSYAPLSVPALQMLTVEVLREAIEGSDMPGRELVLARLPELHARYVLAVDGY